MKNKSGFTLTELLAVIGIIAVLAVIILPVLFMVRGRGDTARCTTNLRHAYQALLQYRADHDDHLPMKLVPLSAYGETVVRCPKSGIPYEYHMFFDSYDAATQRIARSWAEQEWFDGCVVLRCKTHTFGPQSAGDPLSTDQCLALSSNGDIGRHDKADVSKAEFSMALFNMMGGSK